MGKYSVLFDGKWQERFDDFEEALEWAQAVADTGRLVFVARTHILLPPRLLKILPEIVSLRGIAYGTGAVACLARSSRPFAVLPFA